MPASSGRRNLHAKALSGTVLYCSAAGSNESILGLRRSAVGGDSLDLQDGRVWINGEPAEDDRGFGETQEETGAVIYPYKVRENNVFVLGDNREVSMDSRAFGEVNRRQIRGKVLFGFGSGRKREL